jgi:3-isopropylmalate/(R)-2-methylmalate dehydratase large subunit
MARTLFEKLWEAHCVAPLADGGLILIDRILLHERTGGVALKSLADAGRVVADPAHVFATMDHVVDTLPGRTDRTIMATGTDFIRTTRAEAQAAGIRLFDIGDPGQGIVHVISPEQAIVLPGVTLVCPDSHTCSQGALGALAWGIGSTEAEHALATRTLRVAKPKTMRVTVTGRLAAGVTAKDLALFILARHGSGNATGTIPFRTQFPRKIGLKLGATIARMPYSASAQAACSRLEPQPKFSPESSISAPAQAGWFSTKAGSGSRPPISV